MGGTSKTSEAKLNPFEAAAASVEFSMVALHIEHCANAESSPASMIAAAKTRSKRMWRLFIADPYEIQL